MSSLVFPIVARPRVSIVMVTYGGWDFVRRSLALILENTDPSYELILVDNASPDGLGERLLEEVANARVVRNAANCGFGPASNQGANLAVGELLAFVNSDVFVHPDWLPPLLERLDADAGAAAVAPRLLNVDGTLQEAGSAIFANGYTQLVGFGEDPDRPEHRFPRAVDYASAACLLVRRRDFFDVGGFDSIYAPAYFEDVDLCLALRSRRRRVLYEPRSTVTHVRGASWGGGTGLEHWTRNAPVFAQRWSRLLSSRPGFSPADRPKGHRIAARDASATARVLVTADRLAGPLEVGRLRRPSWLAMELAGLYPDARVTLLCRDAPAGSVEPDCLLASGVEALSEEDWPSWLHSRRFHYDVVVLAGEAAVDHLGVVLETQPQAFLVADSAAFSDGIPRAGRSLRRRKTSRVHEIEALTSADVALFASVADVAWARSLRRAETCFLLPASIPEGPPPDGFWSRAGVSFVASEEPAGPADDNALRFLLERVLPLLERENPGIELAVFSTPPADLRRRLESAGVRVCASETSIAEHFARVRVLIAPFLRRPPDSEFLLRAASLGLPFVTSPAAAAGLPFEDLPSEAICDDVRDLVEKISSLHREELRWIRVQRALRRKALRSLDPGSNRATLTEAFARVGLAPPTPEASRRSIAKGSGRRR